MFIAEQLGKFESEILGLSISEFARWIAYFRIKVEEEKKQADRRRRGSKLKTRQQAL